jgi:hypothetical protein
MAGIGNIPITIIIKGHGIKAEVVITGVSNDNEQ